MMACAAWLVRPVEVLRETMGAPPMAVYQEHYWHGVATARAHVHDTAFEEAWAEGRAMTLEHAIAYALEEIGCGIPGASTRCPGC